MVLEGGLVLMYPNIGISRIHKQGHHISYWDWETYWKVVTSLTNIPQQSDTKPHFHRY